MTLLSVNLNKIAVLRNSRGGTEPDIGRAAQTCIDAETRAAAAEGSIADERARAREAAAAWLRGQVEAIRREAGQR